MNVQALCSANHEILWLSVLTVGSTHDSTALNVTKLAEILKDPSHPLATSKLWLAGDDAYKGPAASMHGSMLVPYTGHQDVMHDAFSFFQSRCRINIECTFGELVARWGILWRPMKCSLEHNTEIVQCICRLHNLCLDQREPIRGCRRVVESRETGCVIGARVQHSDDGEPRTLPQTTSSRGGPRVRGPSEAMEQRRQELVRSLKANGLKRPKSSKHSYCHTVASRARDASAT